MLKDGLKGSTVHTRFKWTWRPSYKVIGSAEVAMVTASMLKNSHFFPRPPQFLNFTLVPLYVRTTFTGCCAFVWAIFLCFSQQSGDGTVGAALEWMFPAKRVEAETGDIDSSEQTDTPRDWSVLTQKRQQRWFCGRCLFITGVLVTPLGALECNFLFNTALQERIAAMVTVVWCSRLPLLTYSCKTGMCEGRNCLHGVQWQLFHQHPLWFILSERCTTTQLPIIIYT